MNIESIKNKLDKINKKNGNLYLENAEIEEILISWIKQNISEDSNIKIELQESEFSLGAFVEIYKKGNNNG